MKLKLACLVTLVSIGIHLYLTNHYHQVQLGTMSGESSCNINSTFNCDSVAASDFSSISGVPISAFGFSTNLLILLLLGLVVLRLTETPGKAMRAAYWLAVTSVVASVVMGIVSITQLSTYCLFCIALYILSIIAFLLIYFGSKSEEITLSFAEFINDLKSYAKAPLMPLVMILAVPVIAFFAHKGLESNNLEGSSKDFVRLVTSSIQDWQNNPVHNFDTPPSLVKGQAPTSARITIVEFADFRCGHCQKASGPLKTFVDSHADVQLHFYNFPLDGACNGNIPQSNGVSCRLAKAVHCAGEQKLGWNFHDSIFAAQKDFNSVTSSDGVDKKLKSLLSDSSADWSQLNNCMDSTETHAAIKKQTELATKVGVKGTPKIFMNGKALPAGQFLPVLKKARSIVINQSK